MEFRDYANIQCLTGLRSLSLHLRSTKSSNDIEAFISILEKISASTITKLCFGIRITSDSFRQGWHRFGTVLQESKFSRLTELRLRLNVSQSVKVPVEEWIKEDLIALETRGILRIRRHLDFV